MSNACQTVAMPKKRKKRLRERKIIGPVIKWLDGPRKPKEIIRTWYLRDIKVKTNVGEQITDIKCELEKFYISKRDRTLFEKYIIGLGTVFYRVECTFYHPVRENRDKDFLGPFSEEGNDATHSVSLYIGTEDRGKVVDLSESYINGLIFEHLKTYDPEYKKQRIKDYQEKKEKRTNRTLFRKSFNDYKNEIGLYTAIYPFHSDDLSGWTTILGLRIENDDERGFIFEIGALGFHLYITTRTLKDWFIKIFNMKTPRWESGMSWEEYRKIYKVWAKEHPTKHFFNRDSRFEIGLSRAKGFYLRKEFDGIRHSNSSLSFNPWRNIFWNII